MTTLLLSTAAAPWSRQLVLGTATFGLFVLCVGIALCLVRLVRGPTLADRAAALDVIGIQLVGIVIVLTIQRGTLLFIDGILVLTLLSFAGTVAAAQFIARPHMRSHLRKGKGETP